MTCIRRPRCRAPFDDRFFETPYYVFPGAGGNRAYALLREALRTSGRIGIAKIILRDKQHLAALEVIGEALVLTMMRFADELEDISQRTLPSAKAVRKGELKVARMLIDNLAADWDPAKYTDDYRDNLMRLIKAKMKGKAPKLVAEERPREAEVVDLMERLRQSLGARKKAGAGAKSRGARKRRRAA